MWETEWFSAKAVLFNAWFWMLWANQDTCKLSANTFTRQKRLEVSFDGAASNYDVEGCGRRGRGLAKGNDSGGTPYRWLCWC
jgi:hypothetical protein